MTTEQKLLTIKGEELSRLLGEVLIGEIKQKTITLNCPCGWKPRPKLKHGTWKYKCPYVNCGVVYLLTEDMFIKRANHITLIWPEAMKWRDWAVGECGWEEFCKNLFKVAHSLGVFKPKHSKTIYEWITIEAQPEHYLITAALCKLKGEQNCHLKK